MEIGVYYFPNYHPDKRNYEAHGDKWTEWELVKSAIPKFDGHIQPKVPLWGYENESDPTVMEKKIKTANESGIDCFIFDWYWYEDGPFLQDALNNGFLKAKNSEKIKFALMWANHDWVDIHPAQRSFNKGINTLYNGKISEEAFKRETCYIIDNYFNKPNYWRVNGGLYFSIYMLSGLVESFGGIEETKRIINEFRIDVRNAGLGELHLNAIVWEKSILPGEVSVKSANNLLSQIGFDSVSTYVRIHNNEPQQFPFTQYESYAQKNAEDYEKFSSFYNLPYIPNVTMGWDSSPRTIPSDKYDYLGYPFMPILQNNTPEQFGLALERARNFLKDRKDALQIITINAWNEWTEGSYLEPDTLNGFGYLNAIKNIFVEK